MALVALAQLQHLGRTLALALLVEEHLEHLHLVLATILEASLEIHRPNQEDYLVLIHLVSQLPPQALALGLAHQQEHQIACLELQVQGPVSSHPRTMPLHKINQLALEILEQVLAVGDSLVLQIQPLILLVAHLAPSSGQAVLQLLLLGPLLSLILQLVQILWLKLELALTSVPSTSVLLL